MEVKTANYSPCKKLSLSQKLKLKKKHAKNDSKITLEFFSLKKKKKKKKNIKYSTNKTILKIGHHAKATAFAKRSVSEKIKIQKVMRKTILQSH